MAQLQLPLTFTVPTNAKAVLRDWYFKPRKVNSYRIQVVGYNTVTPAESIQQLEVCTAMIKDRIDRNLIRTESGSVYQIEGACDAEKMELEGGYLLPLIRMFNKGFPSNWKEYLKEDLDRREYDSSFNNKTVAGVPAAIPSTSTVLPQMPSTCRIDLQTTLPESLLEATVHIARTTQLQAEDPRGSRVLWSKTNSSETPSLAPQRPVTKTYIVVAATRARDAEPRSAEIPLIPPRFPLLCRDGPNFQSDSAGTMAEPSSFEFPLCSPRRPLSSKMCPFPLATNLRGMELPVIVRSDTSPFVVPRTKKAPRKHHEVPVPASDQASPAIKHRLRERNLNVSYLESELGVGKALKPSVKTQKPLKSDTSSKPAKRRLDVMNEEVCSKRKCVKQNDNSAVVFRKAHVQSSPDTVEVSILRRSVRIRAYESTPFRHCAKPDHRPVTFRDSRVLPERSILASARGQARNKQEKAKKTVAFAAKATYSIIKRLSTPTKAEGAGSAKTMCRSSVELDELARVPINKSGGREVKKRQGSLKKLATNKKKPIVKKKNPSTAQAVPVKLATMITRASTLRQTTGVQLTVAAEAGTSVLKNPPASKKKSAAKKAKAVPRAKVVAAILPKCTSVNKKVVSHRPPTIKKAGLNELKSGPVRANRTVKWYRDNLKQATQAPPPAAPGASFLFRNLSTLPSDCALAVVDWSGEDDVQPFETLNYTDTTRTFRMSAVSKRRNCERESMDFEPSNAQDASERLNFKGFLEQEKLNAAKKSHRVGVPCAASTSSLWGGGSTVSSNFTNLVVPSFSRALMDEED